MYLLQYVRYTANAHISMHISVPTEMHSACLLLGKKKIKKPHVTVFIKESANIWAGFYTDVIFLACHFSELMIIQL